MSRHVNHTRTAGGFTLVELLVAIAIIVVLAALLLAFYPSIASQTSEANGAAYLQQWLNLARQKAIRNQNPFGVRLWIKDLNTYYVTQCQYIEQPEDLRGGVIVTRDWQNNQIPVWNAVAFDPTGTMDVTGGFTDPYLYLVQPNDYLEVLGTGTMHQIIDVFPGPLYPVAPQIWNKNPPPIPGQHLKLATPIPYQIGQFDPTPPPNGSGLPANGTANFRIVRAPRVISEEMLPLPEGVVVDINVNRNLNPVTNQPYMAALYQNTLPMSPVFGPVPPNPPGTVVGAYIDVIFGPSGSVMTTGLSQATMNFWVRQPDPNNAANIFAGTPSIIAVFGTTGLTGAFPPAPIVNPAINPYMDIQ
jgi:prepilin-type N-terminal cleavage/methylation domain-containing protein